MLDSDGDSTNDNRQMMRPVLIELGSGLNAGA